MTKRKIFAGFAIVTLVAVTLLSINGCKPESNPQPLEPISLVSPDTPISRYFGGDSFPITIKFTTDRPINWILGLVNVDTLIDSTNYVPVYADTSFTQDLTKLNPRQNLYTYTGSYHVADTLPPFSVIYFRVSFQAGANVYPNGTGSQNYPEGVVYYTKDFKINVR
jgi:hypothetical protein